MPESIRSLIVILVLSVFGFYFLKPFAKKIDNLDDLLRWRKLWLVVSCIAFLSSNYWLFVLLSSVYLWTKKSVKPSDKIADYLLLVCCLPPLANNIPGFGGINYIFKLSWPTVVVIVLLLSLFLFKPELTGKKRFFQMPTDLYVFLYVIIVGFLSFRETTFTEGMRPSIHSFFFIIVPYYVLSRYVTSVEHYKKVFLALFVSVSIMSLMAIFELMKAWHLYDSLKTSLGLRGGTITSYKFREGMLRASSAFGAIHLGYMTSVAMCFGFFLVHKIQINKAIIIVYLFLFAALLCTISRGPWVGFFAMWATSTLLGKNGLNKIMKYGTLGAFLLPVLSLTEKGQKFLNLLPFIGSSQADTVSYRQDLFNQSIKVIQRYPAFGSTKYLDEPEMQTLIQGEGIIDIVNTYIQIALEYGLIALALFVTIFLSLMFNIYKLTRTLKKNNDLELMYLGNVIIAALIGTMITIATVSSLGFGITPIMYWALIALGAAYISMVKNKIESNRRNELKNKFAVSLSVMDAD